MRVAPMMGVLGRPAADRQDAPIVIDEDTGTLVIS
jgi:hypothetical protein